MPAENQITPCTNHYCTADEAKNPDVSVRDYWPQKNLSDVFHGPWDVA
jgi:hypothetical protein